MTVERWDPFREMMSLREAMNRLLEESFVRPSDSFTVAGAPQMAIDLAETDDAIVVKASLPGVRPEDIHISVENGVLTISAESKAEEERKGETWLIRERRFGRVQRSLRLPRAVDVDRAEARSEHGVLTLTLPKAEAARPKQIKVKAIG